MNTSHGVTMEPVVDEEDSGQKWAFWKRTRIPDAGDIYMMRLSILITPWFSIKFHKIYRPDAQRELHDHPWSFLSIILWGSYVEEVPGPGRFPWRYGDPVVPRWIRWINFKRAENCHSITWVSRKPVWTMVITGRKRRAWGFWTKNGWVRWDKYDKEA